MSSSANAKRKEPSDTARKRKEHTARILQEKRTERIESTADKEFLCIQKFHNMLPSVPSGPFFKAICLPHSSTDFAGYSMSTLEKNFIWQPHQGVDAGLHIDLVDSEKILAGTDRSVNAADTRYLADRRSTAVPNLERIPWLKRTTYSTNDLYDNVNKFSKGLEELHKGHTDRKIKGIGQNSDPFEVGYVQYAFDAIANKSSTLPKNEAKKDRTVVWSMPVLPDAQDVWGQNLSLVTFGEGTLPVESHDTDEDGAGIDLRDEARRRKRQRVVRSVLTNIRDIAIKSSVKSDSALSQQLYAATMTVPVISSETVEPRDGEYEWLRDLRMDIRNQKLEDNFEFTLDEDEGVCTYCPLRSRIEMKKIDVKHSHPQR
jgi:hypothetical protein